MKYFYRAFTLNIVSDLMMPELPSIADGVPHVQVEIVDRLDCALDKLSPMSFITFDIRNVAHFAVVNGQQILVELCENAQLDEIRPFLLGSAMGAILQQRNFLVLHGNAVVVNGRCLMFVGPSGAGKSTLAGAFLKKGYPVLTDDVCAVSFQDSTPLVAPGYPQIKLWQDSVDKLGEDSRNLRRIFGKIDKYALPLGLGFASQSQALTNIYVLESPTDTNTALTSLRGAAKFGALIANTYRAQFLQEKSPIQEHFDYCQRLAKLVCIKNLARSKFHFCPDQLVDFVLKDLLDPAKADQGDGDERNPA